EASNVTQVVIARGQLLPALGRGRRLPCQLLPEVAGFAEGGFGLVEPASGGVQDARAVGIAGQVAPVGGDIGNLAHELLLEGQGLVEGGLRLLRSAGGSVQVSQVIVGAAHVVLGGGG